MVDIMLALREYVPSVESEKKNIQDLYWGY